RIGPLGSAELFERQPDLALNLRGRQYRPLRSFFRCGGVFGFWHRSEYGPAHVARAARGAGGCWVGFVTGWVGGRLVDFGGGARFGGGRIRCSGGGRCWGV